MDEKVLEKVELIREKAKVGWARAKEALDEAQGDVIAALAWLEERSKSQEKDEWREKFVLQGEEILSTFKGLIREGNIRRVVVRKGDHVFLDIPLTLTVVGVVLAPALAVLGLLAALGTRCTMELERVSHSNAEVVEDTDEGSGEAMPKEPL